MNLIATATEFRQDVRRQHFRVAAGYVDIDIILLQKTVQHIVKGYAVARQGRIFNIPTVLNFINQHIVFASALDFLPKDPPPKKTTGLRNSACLSLSKAISIIWGAFTLCANR